MGGGFTADLYKLELAAHPEHGADQKDRNDG
jgi:hypothetical protein